MNKGMQWFTRNTQQAVMARVSTFPTIARTGPSAKSGKESVSKKSGEGVFVVGKSVVGGNDRVRRTS